MKNILTLLLISIVFIQISLAQEVEKIELRAQKNPMIVLQEKVKLQQKAIDSLVSLVMAQDSNEAIVDDIDNSDDISEDEIALGKLAMKLDNAIFNINKEDNTDYILSFFLPSFSANIVSIDRFDKGSIVRLTRQDFKEYVENVEHKKNVHYKIINIDFLDTEIIRGMFSMTYKTHIEYFEKGEHVSNKTILTTLTGRKTKTTWEVGNYSRTSIEYEPKK